MYEFVNVDETMVGLKQGDKVIQLPGVCPFYDENKKFTNILAVGNKNGIDDKINLPFLKKIFADCKFVFNGRLASYTVKYYNRFIEKEFDGIMAAEYNKDNHKALNMVHSMMVRSMPEANGFFYEPIKDNRSYDFSILTKIGDNRNKRFDRCIRLVDYLCTRHLRGILVTQEGYWRQVTMIGTFDKYFKMGLLKLEQKIEPRAFHKLMNQAKVGVFLSTLDSFPKHIIETLLSDKPIVISDDMTMGKEVCVPDFGIKLTMDKTSSYQRCYEFITNGYKEIKDVRKRYLEKYDYGCVSSLWAAELNRLFGCKHKQVWFYNHKERLTNAGLL